MTLHDWNEMTPETLNAHAARKAIHTERMTVARLALKAGAVVPEHHHENEQVTMLESGHLVFITGGDRLDVRAGQTLVIPPNVPHRVEALEDSLAVDLFAPVREDWLRGDDAYLRGSHGDNPVR
jgi:quercetin dioxygenase-like cupin family protein